VVGIYREDLDQLLLEALEANLGHLEISELRPGCFSEYSREHFSYDFDELRVRVTNSEVLPFNEIVFEWLHDQQALHQRCKHIVQSTVNHGNNSIIVIILHNGLDNFLVDLFAKLVLISLFVLVLLFESI